MTAELAAKAISLFPNLLSPFEINDPHCVCVDETLKQNFLLCYQVSMTMIFIYLLY